MYELSVGHCEVLFLNNSISSSHKDQLTLVNCNIIQFRFDIAHYNFPFQMDTMSSMAPSRAASTIHGGGGSRPTSPYVVNMPHGGHQIQYPADSIV